jgi:ribosomal protein S18 acetylase RimI-like enzyme
MLLKDGCVRAGLSWQLTMTIEGSGSRLSSGKPCLIPFLLPIYKNIRKTPQGAMMLAIRHYEDSTDRAQVIELWRSVFGYETAHNEPSVAISKKIATNDGMFFVATEGLSIIGTVMAGYDGHRGWLYAIAVHPEHRCSGLGSRLVRFAEEALTGVGCMKINLQLLATNEATAAFYKSLGYSVEPRLSMGKVLHTNVSDNRGDFNPAERGHATDLKR